MKTIKFDALYHTGTLNLDDKSNFSYEGDGLSVCIHSSEWRQIAKLEGKEHQLTKDGNKFADAYSINDEVVTKWGIEKGLIEECKLYRFEFGDESGELCYMEFLSEEEASVEAEDYGSDVLLIEGFKPTEKMISRMKVRTDHSLYMGHLVGLYVQDEHPEFDGIWFEDELDVYGLSAPRGMIFRSKLNSWTVALFD